jgi:hypothetical protein
LIFTSAIRRNERTTCAGSPGKVEQVPPDFFEGVVSITRGFEALAASIGSGLVVGGFVGGAGSFAWTRSRRVSEKWALFGSYVGGLAALTSLAIDIVEKRFV